MFTNATLLLQRWSEITRSVTSATLHVEVTSGHIYLTLCDRKFLPISKLERPRTDNRSSSRQDGWCTEHDYPSTPIPTNKANDISSQDNTCHGEQCPSPEEAKHCQEAFGAIAPAVQEMHFCLDDMARLRNTETDSGKDKYCQTETDQYVEVIVVAFERCAKLNPRLVCKEIGDATKLCSNAAQCSRVESVYQAHCAEIKSM